GLLLKAGMAEAGERDFSYRTEPQTIYQPSPRGGTTPSQTVDPSDNKIRDDLAAGISLTFVGVVLFAVHSFGAVVLRRRRAQGERRANLGAPASPSFGATSSSSRLRAQSDNVRLSLVAPKLYLGIVLHNHQPVGNYGFVIEQVYNDAYLPMLEALERRPGVRVALHNSGPLFDWIRDNRPDYIDRLRAMCARGQIEMVTGGYYEPILPMIPDADKIGQ